MHPPNADTLIITPSDRKRRRKRLSKPVLSEWFVVKTKTNQERHAAIAIRRKGYSAFAPYIAGEVHGHYRESPLFPGHIFVRGQQWYFLKATSGVLYPIMMGEQPGYMPVKDMSILLRVSADDDLIATEKHEKFVQGDKLRIRTGPWKDHWGSFLGAKGKDRVRLLMTVLGAQHELEFQRRIVTLREAEPVDWRELAEGSR